MGEVWLLLDGMSAIFRGLFGRPREHEGRVWVELTDEAVTFYRQRRSVYKFEGGPAREVVFSYPRTRSVVGEFKERWRGASAKFFFPDGRIEWAHFAAKPVARAFRDALLPTGRPRASE